MLPKNKITRKTILMHALHIAKEKGIAAVTSRSVAKAAQCSIQPVSSQFATMEELVRFAKEYSPYFEKLYKDIGADFKLSDLPVTNKVELLRVFDDWVTDRTITLQRVNDFMKDKDNIGRKLDKKYMVNTTSGSTGNPCIVLYDRQMQQVTDAIGALRTFSRKEDMRAYIKSGGKSLGLYADDGFYVGCGSIRKKLLMMPWKKGKLGLVDVRKPTAQIVERLNQFQPALLGGYPTALELLIPEQQNGNLHISPVIINTGGEYLSEATRNAWSSAFGCYVQTNYACTEGGTIANECLAHHFHINDDWVMIEAVDERNHPVRFGTQSAKILLTNLANYIQPIIRFEVTDRVIMHQDNCPCGKTGMWLELRLAAEHPEQAFRIAKQAVEEFLAQNEITASVYLSAKQPEASPISGKFKHIIAKYWRCACFATQ